MPLIGYLCFYICERKALDSSRLYERRGSSNDGCLDAKASEYFPS